MPAKKKTSKKSRSKKLVSKKPVAEASAPPVAAPTAEPVATSKTVTWQVWVPLLVLVVLAVFFALRAVSSSDKIAPSQAQGSDTPSTLRVVPGEDGGTSSMEASGALQPQPTGLQQAQPTTQSPGSLNLQAQTTTDQTIIH